MPVRWETLFDDLEAQLGDALEAEERDLRVLRERQRQAALTLRDRLVDLSRPGGGDALPITISLRTGGRLLVRPLSFGRDWFAAQLTDVPGDVQAIVPLAAVAGVRLPVSDAAQGAGARDAVRGASTAASATEISTATATATPATGGGARIRIAERIGLAIMLRDLARRRVALDLVLPGETVHGTLDRVGADHVEAALHDADSARRGSAVVERRLIPLDRIDWVRL